jgi:predicted transcriptional regulator
MPMMIAEKHTNTRQEIHIRLSSQVKSRLEVLAKELDCSLTHLVRDVLREFVGKRVNKTK